MMKSEMKSKSLVNQSGQIALMVVLSLLVGSAVVLSVVGRTITETRLTSEEDESAKTLRTAEAGVEEALRTLSQSNFSGTLDGQSYSVSVVPSNDTGYLSGRPIVAGEVLEVSLVGSNAESLSIYWSDKGDSKQIPGAAVQIVVYTADTDPTQQGRRTIYTAGDVEYFDFDWDTTRLAANFFDNIASLPRGNGLPTGQLNPPAFAGRNFVAKVNIPLQGREVSLRVRPLYNQATIGIEPVGRVRRNVTYSLPSQQYKAVVEAKGEGNVAKKIEVTRSLPTLPEIFDASLYSGVGLGQ